MSSEFNNVQAPWLKVLGDLPSHLDYPECSMVGLAERTAEAHPDMDAYIFSGRRRSAVSPGQ